MAYGDSVGAKGAGTWTASTTGVMALSESLFRTSCSWRSGGLFGQSFSIALPVQALRGLPCLGSFSAVQLIRHMEQPPTWGPTLHQALKGAPWVGSYSADRRIRHLKGHPGWGPTL